jgi:hypothetical protein
MTMTTSRHCIPARQYVIALIKAKGLRAVYGDRFKANRKAEIIARLERFTDAQYVEECGCDHHDAAGNCLGHEKTSK